MKTDPAATSVELQRGSPSPAVSGSALRDKADCIVAIKPCCNRVVFATVNAPKMLDAKTRKEIGTMVAEGYKIEHWTTEQVRNGNWGCKCKSPNVRTQPPRE